MRDPEDFVVDFFAGDFFAAVEDFEPEDFEPEDVDPEDFPPPFGAGVFFGAEVFFGAGAFARFSASSSKARSLVSDSTEVPRGTVTLMSPSVT